MERLGDFVHRLDQLIWGPWLLILLLGSGVFLMARMRFLPLRRLGWALRMTVSGEAGGASGEEKSASQRGVSPFASLMTELAATIGVGNIVGVATAMLSGGPGALLWMIAASLFGMALKLAESTLSVKYREKNELGDPVGGPMYTLKKRFPIPALRRTMAASYAAFAVLASFGMGNMTQSNAIAETLRQTWQVPEAKTGLAVAILTILVVLGGISAIGRVTIFVVPFMGLFYLGGALLVLSTHPERLLEGIVWIVRMAFRPEAVSGGVCGSMTITLFQSLKMGVSRGVFSNEAGLGAAGITAAAADTSDPVKQGFISMTGVFWDTCVICALTGLTLCASGVLEAAYEAEAESVGSALVIRAFETTMGSFGGKFVGICIVLFAFATVIGWAYQGEKAFEYLCGTVRYRMAYRFFYGLAAFVGAVCPLRVVWEFSDVCNGLMAVPNLLCVLALSGEAAGLVRKYCGDGNNMVK